MRFFISPRRDLVILFLGLAAFFVLWFASPIAIKKTRQYRIYLLRSVIPSGLSRQEERAVQDHARQLRASIRAGTLWQGEPYARQYELLARDYERLGMLGRAERYFSKSLRESPQDVSLLLQRARVYQMMGYLSRAERDYRAVIDVSPTRPDVYQKLADLYFYDRSDSDTARGVYLEGLLKTHNDLSLMKLFANFLELAGNRREAYLYWDAVLQNDNNQKEVAEHLKTLQDAAP